MNNQPDLSFYFAVHQAQRDALARYSLAVNKITPQERSTRGKALSSWVRGFILELEEHHYVEDKFFFPSLRAKVSTAAATLDRLHADHRHLDELLEAWPLVSAKLADPTSPFETARADAISFANEISEFLGDHLAVEDQDVLPLYWRHFTVEEYDVVFQQAVKKGKKAGLWFVAPFAVDCYPVGPERDAFLASAPGALRLLHRLVRPRYDRLVTAAFGSATTTINAAEAA